MSAKFTVATKLLAGSVVLGATIGCDYTGDWLFAGAVERLGQASQVIEVDAARPP